MRCLVVAALLSACAHASHPACSGTLPLADDPAAPGEPRASSEGVIDSIAVTGAPDIGPIAARVLESQVGQLVSMAPVSDDVRRLWALGLFSDVRVHARDTGVRQLVAHESYPRLALEFEVTPRGTIDRVRVEGSGAHQPELRRMHWIAGTPYEPRRLARMADAIELAYVRDGRLDAKIAVRRARTPGVSLCVIAEPGPRVTIRKLTFPGHGAVSEGELVAAMKGKYVNHPGEPYDADALELDRSLLLARYWERGLVDARILPPRIVRHGNRLDVAIPVEPGPVYRIGEVRVDGGFAPPREIVPGQVFVRSRMLDGMRALETRLGTGANVTPQTEVDAKTHRIDLTLHVEWSWPWRALHLLPWF